MSALTSFYLAQSPCGSIDIILILAHGEVLGACSTFAADRPGIAVPPGLVHSPRGDFLTVGNNDKREKFVKFMDFLTIGNKVPYFYGKML